MIIPGHGRLSDMADVAYYRDMVTIIRDRVQDLDQEGADARAGESGEAHARLRRTIRRHHRPVDDRHVRRRRVQDAQREKDSHARDTRMSRALTRIGSSLPRAVVAPLTLSAQAQRGRGAAPAPAGDAKQQAPIDLTGYWVSVVTEDWRYRMVTAPKGDHPGLPLNAEGNRIANAWDPAKDEAAGDQCKAYGAGRRDARTRPPPRHVGRRRCDEAGDRSRHADAACSVSARPGAAASAACAAWQGTSVAQWEMPAADVGADAEAPPGRHR